jgi:thioredoxin 1
MPIRWFNKIQMKGDTMADKAIVVTDANFEEIILKSPLPSLVDFWAAWCGPCRVVSPIVEELAADYQGRLNVAKCNVDENPSTPSKYGIRGIPTLIVFKNGQEVAREVGAVPRAKIEQLIQKVI